MDPLYEVKYAYTTVSREESHKGVLESSSVTESKLNATYFPANFPPRFKKYTNHVKQSFTAIVDVKSSDKQSSVSSSSSGFTSEQMKKLLSLINDIPSGRFHANMAGGILLRFWSDSVLTVVYLINRLSSSILNGFKVQLLWMYKKINPRLWVSHRYLFSSLSLHLCSPLGSSLWLALSLSSLLCSPSLAVICCSLLLLLSLSAHLLLLCSVCFWLSTLLSSVSLALLLSAPGCLLALPLLFLSNSLSSCFSGSGLSLPELSLLLSLPSTLAQLCLLTDLCFSCLHYCSAPSSCSLLSYTGSLSLLFCLILLLLLLSSLLSGLCSGLLLWLSLKCNYDV
ncbi:hypothetical protein Tco_1007486 [Tanacetum coccineum]